ncbi:MAG: tRNA pseudouridine(55) synthase TruB [Eubacteriales bacterium]
MENDINGVIIVNKHKGVTSHDIVAKIRRIYGTKKVGHTGTLDPMATGVLPILIGRAAKAAEYLVSDSKRYVAEIKLGIETDTEDITGKILKTSDTLPGKTEFFKACKEFVGEIYQTPPMYSALKVGGKKLVDLAREGKEVERTPRKIEIKSILPEEVSEKEGIYTLDVECSKGTYIRTLCADIGKKLGCGAVMSSLERTRSGNFDIKDAYTVCELENMTPEQRASVVRPVETLFSELPAVTLDGFYAKLCRNGCEIYQRKIKTAYPVDEFVRIRDKNGFFALGKVKEYENGSTIKAVKIFVL